MDNDFDPSHMWSVVFTPRQLGILTTAATVFSVAMGRLLWRIATYVAELFFGGPMLIVWFVAVVAGVAVAIHQAQPSDSSMREG